jgi:hypothetical protein
MVSPSGVTCRVFTGSRLVLTAGFLAGEMGARFTDVCWAAAGIDTGSTIARHNASPRDFRTAELLADDDNQSNMRFSYLQR